MSEDGVRAASAGAVTTARDYRILAMTATTEAGGMVGRELLDLEARAQRLGAACE